jgi:hypothetical protein
MLRFEETARDTQQSSEIMDLGLVQQAGPMAQLFTMFMTAPASYYRQVSAAIRNMKKAPGDSLKRLVLFGVIVPVVFETIASLPLAWDEDEEDRELLLKRMGRAVAMSATDGLFIMRDVARYIYNVAFLKEEAWLGPSFTSVGQPVEDLGKAIRKAKKEDWTGVTEAAIDIVGYSTGYPLPAVQNYVQGFLDEDTEHPIARKLGYSRYATGD